MAHNLNKGHVACQIVDGIDLGAIDILIGIVLQQITIGMDAEFVAQYLLPVGTHPRQVLYVLIEDIHCLEVRS
jgi:hypothetical protein